MVTSQNAETNITNFEELKLSVNSFARIKETFHWKIRIVSIQMLFIYSATNFRRILISTLCVCEIEMLFYKGLAYKIYPLNFLVFAFFLSWRSAK